MSRPFEVTLSAVVAFAIAVAVLFAAGCDDAEAYKALHPAGVRVVARPIVCWHHGNLMHAGVYRMHCGPKPVEVCEVPK